jgi:phosphatidylglycerol:prolipoprotein diacylglycerol transferase
MLLHLHVLGAEIPSHLAFLALAVVVCHWLGPRWATGIKPSTTRWVLVWLGVAAFAGGRLHFAVNAWPFASFSRNPVELLRFWEGMHAGGALVGLVVAAPLVLRLYGITVGRFADAIAPTIGVGIAIARGGCFLRGCCFGTPSEMPWAVVFPAGSPPQAFQSRSGLLASDSLGSVPTHPLQLYFALAGIAGACAAVAVRGRGGYEGRAALAGLAVYLVLAAAAEPFRAASYASLYFWGSTLQFQWIAVAMAAVALLALALAEIASRGRQAPQRSAPVHVALTQSE